MPLAQVDGVAVDRERLAPELAEDAGLREVLRPERDPDLRALRLGRALAVELLARRTRRRASATAMSSDDRRCASSQPSSGSGPGFAAAQRRRHPAAACGTRSSRSALTRHQTSPTITNVNGTEASTAPCCSALSPPTSSSAEAIAPIRQPITAVTVLAGWSTPREASIPITIEAASAPLMKKNAIRIIDRTDVIVVNGSCSSAVKSDSSGVAVVAIRSAAPLICMSMRGGPDDREPDEAHAGRHRHDADDELADRPAARDAGDERADEGRPGDPPRPVEDRPRGHPVGLVNVSIRRLIGNTLRM